MTYLSIHACRYSTSQFIECDCDDGWTGSRCQDKVSPHRHSCWDQAGLDCRENSFFAAWDICPPAALNKVRRLLWWDTSRNHVFSARNFDQCFQTYEWLGASDAMQAVVGNATLRRKRLYALQVKAAWVLHYLLLNFITKIHKLYSPNF